jgi:DNA-3-methyladenine glycosylase I
VTSGDLVVGPDGRARCRWAAGAPDYLVYHDAEWGKQVRGDDALFERLTLEAFQSGLSWLTILRKRPAFRAAFHRFAIATVAGYGEQDVARLMGDPGIVRNRAKIEATVANARTALDLPDGLSALLWSYAPAPRPRPASLAQVPPVTPESTAMARELKRRGFRFVGPTTAYALMQAAGMVDDHLAGCHVLPGGRLYGSSLGGPLDLVPYDPAWPARFVALRDRLAVALGPVGLRIDHIGSTAVPGLAAKDVIDIQVIVADESDSGSYRPRLESDGVGLRYQEPGWSFFRPMEPPRIFHVHVTGSGSDRERAQLLFVDYLRAHGEHRDAYAALKAELADRFPDDRVAYSMAKTAFIVETLRRAETWAAATGWQVPPVNLVK